MKTSEVIDASSDLNRNSVHYRRYNKDYLWNEKTGVLDLNNNNIL